MRLSDLDEYAETMMAQRISMVDGVAQVQVFGAAKYAVRVQVDPNKLAAPQHRPRTKSTPRSRTGTSISRPARCTGRSTAYNVQANGQLMKAANTVR